MNKIKGVSKIFRFIFQLSFIALIGLTIIGWTIAPKAIELLGHGNGFRFTVIPDFFPILHTPSIREKIYGFLISLAPLAINLWLVASLVKLFKLYEQGKIFILNSARAIKHSGLALLLSQIIKPFYEAALSPVLTWHNPIGHRTVMASFDGTNLGLITTSIIILLISWVMTEACKLKQENELVI